MYRRGARDVPRRRDTATDARPRHLLRYQLSGFRLVPTSRPRPHRFTKLTPRSTGSGRSSKFLLLGTGSVPGSLRAFQLRCSEPPSHCAATGRLGLPPSAFTEPRRSHPVLLPQCCGELPRRGCDSRGFGLRARTAICAVSVGVYSHKCHKAKSRLRFKPVLMVVLQAGVLLSETLPGSSGTPSSLHFLDGPRMDSISPY